MEDGLMPGLPKEHLVDVVSRLSAKDACRLKLLSKAWLSLISSDSEFKTLHRLRAPQRPSLLVLTHAISDQTSPGLFIEEDPPSLPHSISGDGEDFASRKVVFNYQQRLEDLREFAASCRDLMCFYNARAIYVYSPSTNQYLCYDLMVTSRLPHEFKVGLVYVASMNLYKIVKFEVEWNPSCLSHPTVRFEAITVPEEKDEPRGGGEGNNFDADEHRTSSWELICEHPISGFMRLGNMICLNGAVYAIARLRNSPKENESKVLYVDFEEDDNKQQHTFKMISLPETACYERNCHFCKHTLLSQVKNLLCYPHTGISSLDLWLLKDRNACNWVKSYSFSYPPPRGVLRHFVFSPHPTTTTTVDAAAAGDDDVNPGPGLYLYSFGREIFQHDTRTKDCTVLLKYKHTQELHVFSDKLYSLKNGLSCSRVPAKIPSPQRPTKKLQHKPPPPPPLKRKASPPRPGLINEMSVMHFERLKRIMALQQPPPPPPPPLSSLTQPPQISFLPPPPPPPPPYSLTLPPQGSIPPSSYLYPKVQHMEYQIESLPPLCKGIPRPRPFNPEDFQYNFQLKIDSSGVKRRKSIF